MCVWRDFMCLPLAFLVTTRSFGLKVYWEALHQRAPLKIRFVFLLRFVAYLTEKTWEKLDTLVQIYYLKAWHIRFQTAKYQPFNRIQAVSIKNLAARCLPPRSAAASPFEELRCPSDELMGEWWGQWAQNFEWFIDSYHWLFLVCKHGTIQHERKGFCWGPREVSLKCNHLRLPDCFGLKVVQLTRQFEAWSWRGFLQS